MEQHDTARKGEPSPLRAHFLDLALASDLASYSRQRWRFWVIRCANQHAYGPPRLPPFKAVQMIAARIRMYTGDAHVPQPTDVY